MHTSSLSTKKGAVLLERLLRLKERTEGGALSETIEQLITALQEGKQHIGKLTLTNHIVGFMHNGYGPNYSETVETITDVCPEFLEAKQYPLDYRSCPEEKNNLPILTATARDNGTEYIPLLAKLGCKHGTGGSEARGGLLSTGYHDTHTDCNVLQALAANTPQILEKLLHTDPPLFFKEDVKKYNLISYCSFHREIVDFLVSLDPTCLYQKKPTGLYPTEQAIEWQPDLAFYVFTKAVEYDPKHPSVGGLFGKSNTVDILNQMIVDFEYDEKNLWNEFEKVLSAHKDIPILHKFLQHAYHRHDFIREIITRFPDSVFLRDEDGRLPIHIALNVGMKWSTELVSIMSANMSHLDFKDPVTGYFPYALAALEPSCDLRTINHLLRLFPGQSHAGIRRKRKDQSLKADLGRKRKNESIEIGTESAKRLRAV